MSSLTATNDHTGHREHHIEQHTRSHTPQPANDAHLFQTIDTTNDDPRRSTRRQRHGRDKSNNNNYNNSNNNIDNNTHSSLSPKSTSTPARIADHIYRMDLEHATQAKRRAGRTRDEQNDKMGCSGLPGNHPRDGRGTATQTTASGHHLHSNTKPEGGNAVAVAIHRRWAAHIHRASFSARSAAVT